MTKEQRIKVIELFCKGYDQRQVADELGVDYPMLTYWRIKCDRPIRFVRITDEEREYIRSRAGKETQEEVAGYVGCHRSSVGKIWRENGFHSDKKKDWSCNEEQRLMKLKKEGKYFREIADILNRGMGSVVSRYYKIIRR